MKTSNGVVLLSKAPKKKDILFTQFKGTYEFRGLIEQEFDECPVCLYDVSHCYCETNREVPKDEPEYLAT